MSVRTSLRCVVALGILIGAGGCSSDSPTAPFVPSSSAATKGGTGMIGSGNAAGRDTTTPTLFGGHIGSGNAVPTAETTSNAFGGHIGSGN